jgi:hypothetical protein
LSQNNYVYEEFYDDVLVYDEKMFIIKIFKKHHKLTCYKIMMFFVIITHMVIIVANLDLLTRLLLTWLPLVIIDPHVNFDIKLKI